MVIDSKHLLKAGAFLLRFFKKREKEVVIAFGDI